MSPRATRHSPSSDKENGDPTSPKRSSRRTIPQSQLLHRKVLNDGVDKSKYDPDQSLQERRAIRKKYRDMARNIEDNRNELLKPDNTELLHTLTESEHLFSKVRQTSDATLDSRLILAVTETAAKKIQNLAIGKSAGLSVDEFVGKCISHMRSNPGVRADPDTDDAERNFDELDWAFLGRTAAFRSSRRAALPDFLLGPLSITKKARAARPRRQGLRARGGDEARVTEMDSGEIQQNENSALQVVYRIRDVLLRYFDAREIDDGVNLFEVVVNPRSYAQTVENIFYVSFLAKEGKVAIWENDDGIPVLAVSEPATEAERQAGEAKKTQMIFSLTMWEWKQIIDVFGIKECIIPHREEKERTVTATGWYA